MHVGTSGGRNDRAIQYNKLSKFSSGSFSCNTGSIRDDPYWTSGKNSLELMELCSIKLV